MAKKSAQARTVGMYETTPEYEEPIPPDEELPHEPPESATVEVPQAGKARKRLTQFERDRRQASELRQRIARKEQRIIEIAQAIDTLTRERDQLVSECKRHDAMLLVLEGGEE